jgi:hypothetical protein
LNPRTSEVETGHPPTLLAAPDSIRFAAHHLVAGRLRATVGSSFDPISRARLAKQVPEWAARMLDRIRASVLPSMGLPEATGVSYAPSGHGQPSCSSLGLASRGSPP